MVLRCARCSHWLLLVLCALRGRVAGSRGSDRAELYRRHRRRRHDAQQQRRLCPARQCRRRRSARRRAAHQRRLCRVRQDHPATQPRLISAKDFWLSRRRDARQRRSPIWARSISGSSTIRPTDRWFAAGSERPVDEQPGDGRPQRFVESHRTAGRPSAFWATTAATASLPTSRAGDRRQRRVRGHEQLHAKPQAPDSSYVASSRCPRPTCWLATPIVGQPDPI